jgi:iron complex outermembrane recepter protein
MPKITKLLMTTALVASALPALAQTSQDVPAADGTPAREASVHNTSSEVVVTAPFVRELDLLAGRSVVTGDELVLDLRPQIGDSLTRQPGVSATSFAPGASRPVLRGFQGERIRVLTDGLGSLDVSNTSVDHAVTVEPLTAERIEILRGPASLLFGSQAIGGVVNVIDRRIPRALPEQGFHLDATGAYGSAADERGGAASLDVALTSNIVAHVDGSYRNTDDLRVGGFVLSPTLRAQQLALAAEETAEGNADEAAEATEFANLRGRLPNSATETFTLGGGIALINEGGSLGFSAGYFDTRYGVPERPGAGHAHGGEEGEEEEGEEEGPVAIDLRQFRADMRGEIVVGGGFLDRIRTRIGYADYTHTEFEGTEVGTVFDSEAFEGRLELVQADRNGWRGVTGFQGFTRDFSAVGAEAFVPPNRTDQYGVFTLQEFELGRLGLELSGRYERTNVRSDQVRIGLEEDAVVTAVGRGFDALSGAIGLSYALTPAIKIGVNGSRAERAPSAEELFSNGPHVATQAFEVGDPGFTTEKSLGLEVYARGDLGPVRFQVAGYATWFDDYIFEAATGEEVDELPLFLYQQADARYLGVEAELAATLVNTGSFRIDGNLVTDYVHAELSDGSAVPRIPPFRVLAGLTATAGSVGARVEVEHSAAQTRVADFETPTDDFTLVNAALTLKPFGQSNETVVTVSANNIFDVDARRHASFTNDFVPLPGRDIRVGVRFSF